MRFMGITPETSALLPQFWKVVQPILPTVLDEFYRHVGAVPALSKLVGNDAPRLKAAQTSHWERLFSGRFDDAYFAGSRTIGLMHNKIGLEPRWYIGGYNFVLSRLTALAVHKNRWSPSKASAIITAVNCAVMLDMDIAISVYQEAMIEDRARRGKRLDELMQDFEAKASGMVGQVATAASQLQATAKTMTGIAGEATHQSASVAAAAEEASVSVQTVAASAEELSGSIAEISRQVAHSAQIASKAVADAERTDRIVNALAEGAQKIGDVVSLINNIAGQTNLLALNATIEAARAGDAGKGFAVVATEVKSLASQTARATEDIAQQINHIQSATKEAVTAIQGIAATIGEVNSIAATIAAAVEEQGAATQEIARSVQQAASGTSEVGSTIAKVSQGANETGAAAGQVLEATGSLSTQAEALRTEVTTFLANIKAA